jgi:hypothetical protein
VVKDKPEAEELKQHFVLGTVSKEKGNEYGSKYR